MRARYQKCADRYRDGFRAVGLRPGADKSADIAQEVDRLQSVQHPDKADVSPEKIASDIVGRVIRVSDVAGAGEPTEWTFDKKEFRHVEVLERKVTGNTQTLVVFLTTRSNPDADEEQVQVSGKLATPLRAQRRAVGTYRN